MMIYKVYSRAFDLRGELRDIMDYFGIQYGGFSNMRGSKCPTFYSNDEKMETILGQQITTYKHRVFISKVSGITGKYYASFQPHLTKIYKK